MGSATRTPTQHCQLPLLRAGLPATETNTEPPVWTLPRGDQPASGYRFITLDPFHQGRSSVLLLLEQALALDKDKSSPGSTSNGPEALGTKV